MFSIELFLGHCYTTLKSKRNWVAYYFITENPLLYLFFLYIKTLTDYILLTITNYERSMHRRIAMFPEVSRVTHIEVSIREIR